MRRSCASFLATAALPLLLLSGCAAVGLHPDVPSQSITRQQLRPEYRVFYDALRDYGDWTLIEPVGWVFRPNVVWNQWQPFDDGFWAPTDVYGWVWISSEPFGWATYHYGRWFFDQFQGWVWAPGSDWGPAWVRWEMAGDYVGWAPLPPTSDGYNLTGSTLEGAPGSSTHYAPISALGSTDLKQRLVNADKIGHDLVGARPIRNLVERDGVTINRGPAMDVVESKTGPLPRVTLEDLVPGDLARQPAPAPAAPGGTTPAKTMEKGPTSSPAGTPLAPEDPAEITRRAAVQAADEARRFSSTAGIAPATVPMVRPLFGPKPATPAPGMAPAKKSASPKPAAADSSR
jgi:hypothetical protein